MIRADTTVIVPSFNSGKFLKWTLDSIAKQTLKNFECIVVDDCSSDKSIEQASAAFSDPRFRLIKHKVNMGLSGARNTGLRAAKSPYVAFLDSDDLMMSNSLEVRLNACKWGIKQSDQFAGSYCGSVEIKEDEQLPPPSFGQKLQLINFVESKGLCPFNANQPMLRTDVLRKSGGFNMALNQAEDFDLWVRILRAGYVFAPAHHCSVTYRKRSRSMIRQAPLDHLSSALAIIKSCEQPLLNDQIDWSIYRMSKPLNEYANQKKILNRVMEFCGMGLAASPPISIAQLVYIIQTNLPDINLFANPASSLFPLIWSGVKRQLGNIPSEYQAKCTELEKRILESKPPPSSNFEKQNVFVYNNKEKDRIWFSSQQKKYSIFFIPHSPYHVWTISLLKDELLQGGMEFITVDISAECGNSGLRDAAAKYDIKLISLSEFFLGSYQPSVIVVFNDWDPITRPILVAAQTAGIKTIAIVEGIQDYDDADVHWQRYAYKTASLILLPGEYDRKYFRTPYPEIQVVGVPRIYELRVRSQRRWDFSNKPRVLINCNFSYGVLEGHRDRWLTDSVNAVLSAGMTPVISKHPGDKGKLFEEFTSKESFYNLLENCEVSVQRFASGILEALARQVGVVYYNPHGEKVDKFQENPMAAYVVKKNPTELEKELLNWWRLHEMARDFGPRFLDHHSGKTSQNSILDCARQLVENASNFKNKGNHFLFKKNIEILDLKSVAFFDPKPFGHPLFPNPKSAEIELNHMRNEFDNNKQGLLIRQATHPAAPASSIAHESSPLSNYFAKANSLYRECDYAEALKIYHDLYQVNQLCIYRMNARMAETKLKQITSLR